jgi:cell division protein FtsL
LKGGGMRGSTISLPFGLSKSKSGQVTQTQVVNTALLVGLVLLGFGYLFIINSLGTKGYEIRKVEQQIANLEAQKNSLQLDASNLQSIDKIQSNAQQLNFVPSTNVTYIKDPNFALK